MHRKTRAITLVGAIGLSLVSASTGAQDQGWNLVRPQYCFEYSSSANGQTTSTLIVYTQTYTFQVAGPVMQGAVLQWCYSGSAFYAYNDGPNHPWWMFWIVPGLK
jgi:hypothetical protein